jgi:hypothetical protein
VARRNANDDPEELEDLDPEELEEDDDEGDDEDDTEDLSEEELRAELKKVRDSLSKASGSSKKKRDRIKSLEADLAAARTPKKDDDAKDDKPDLDAVKAAAKAEAKAEANDRVKKAEARGALKAAGIPKEQVGAIVGMLKLEDVDVDDDGEVEGIDEAIADLRSRFPQLFPKSTRKRERVAGEGDRGGNGDKVPRKAKSASELQAEVALGRVRR